VPGATALASSDVVERPSIEPTAEVAAPVAAPPPSASVAPVEPPPTSGFVCAPPDHGMGRYHPYVALPGRGRLLVPELDVPPADGAFDLMLHFHFHDAVRRAFVEVAHPMALAGIDLGEGSKAYGDAFANPDAITTLLASIDDALRERTGDPRAHVGRLFLSSWSAGFAASVRILKQKPRPIAGALFLDSLYAPSEKNEHGDLRPRSVFAPAVAPVAALGKRAVAGEAFLFLSYSHAETHGYASTGDVAHHLEKKLGLREKREDPGDDPRGLIASVDAGRLHVRGFRGVDGKAHCRHLALIKDAISLLRGETRELPASVP
jgi:hypothetical protein